MHGRGAFAANVPLDAASLSSPDGDGFPTRSTSACPILRRTPPYGLFKPVSPWMERA